jgi:thioredoxin
VTIIEQGSGPAPQAPADLIKETTTQTFVKDVIEESKRQPVLIDFWAPWCGPCRQLTPIIEKAVKAAGGKVKLVKMNIDEHPAIPGQMGIQSIPAVIAFVNGQPADGFMGAVPESQVTAFIDKLTAGMPNAGEPNIAEILQEAEAVLAEGDPAGAAQIYAEVLAVDATNIPALAGLAKCYVATGAVEQPRRSVRSPSWNRKSPQTRSIIRRDSIWRRRSTPMAIALRRPSSCSRSSSATANGTRMAPASNWSSSSRPGVRPTRPPSRGASGCRPCFSHRDFAL